MNPIEKLDSAIALVEDGLASKEEVMFALAFKQQLGRIYRALCGRFDQAAIAWIEQNGEITEGEKRWFVGTETKRTCKSVDSTVRAILELEGVEGLVRSLSTTCFCPAAAMDMLGQDAAQYFDSKTTPDLKTGKPMKVLKGIPTKMIGTADDLGGTNDEDNLQTECRTCNIGTGPRRVVADAPPEVSEKG